MACQTCPTNSIFYIYIYIMEIYIYIYNGGNIYIYINGNIYIYISHGNKYGFTVPSYSDSACSLDSMTRIKVLNYLLFLFSAPLWWWWFRVLSRV